MALMESIRRGTDSTAMKVVFGLIVIVFVFFGISPTGNRGQIIAEVNGEQISDTDLQRMMRNFDSSMDADAEKDLQRQLIDGLIEQRVLLQEAERLGLVVSIEEIALRVQSTEVFQTDDGKFSPKLYESLLKSQGMSKGVYEDQLREGILLEKLQRLVATSARITDPEVSRQLRAMTTSVGVAWVKVADEDLVKKVPVTDAEVSEWISTHEVELKEAYDQQFNTLWSRPRQLDVSTILLRTDLDQGRVPEEDLRGRLETLRTQILGGADVGELAVRNSEDLVTVGKRGRLGPQTEEQLGEDLAEAAMAAGAGGVSEVVRTARGLQVVYVHEITEPTVTPMEEAGPTIARDRIARSRVAEFGGTVAEDILAAWTDPSATPLESLVPYGLEVIRSGPFNPAQPALLGLGSAPEFEAAIAAAMGPGMLDRVYPAAGGRVVGGITSFDVPDEAFMERMMPQARAALEQQKGQMFFSQYAKDLVSKARVKQLYIP